jgi:hypothetical protein
MAEMTVERLTKEKAALESEIKTLAEKLVLLNGALQFCNYMIGVMSAPADASPKEHTDAVPSTANGRSGSFGEADSSRPA